MAEPTLVLASSSPRRADLLTAAGYTFVVDPADVDESVEPGEPASAYVARIAAAKAHRVAARRPGSVVLAADTTVALDEAILGKPDDVDAAVAMLSRLSGRTHQVHTSVVVWTGREALEHTATSDVTMAPLTPGEIARYVGRGESFDKAGGYGLQGAGVTLVESVGGSPSNVIGLPVRATVRLLAAAGVHPGRA